jgi:transcriptional regulator with XRE-family HTH domain
VSQRPDDPGGELPQSRVSDLGAYIRNQRESAKLSLRKLSKLAGVSNPYLSQIERGLRKPSAEILQAIARALSISSETLYVKAGILEERDFEPDLEEAVDRDPFLTAAQKTTLVEMYRSLRRLAELEQNASGAESVRHGGIQGLFEAMSTGDVDDGDLAAATTQEESDEPVRRPRDAGPTGAGPGGAGPDESGRDR